MRILAIDYGSKRVGLATGDTNSKLALPSGVLTCDTSEELLEKIRRLVVEENIGMVIVGDPVSLAGDISAQTKTTRVFASNLQTVLTVPVEMFDERLTSQRADVARFSNGKTRSRDELAAMYLLQDYLEKMVKT